MHHQNIGHYSIQQSFEFEKNLKAQLYLFSQQSTFWKVAFDFGAAPPPNTPTIIYLRPFLILSKGIGLFFKLNNYILQRRPTLTTSEEFLKNLASEIKNVAKRSYKQFPWLCYHFCTYIFIFCKCSTILCKINFKCSTILVS